MNDKAACESLVKGGFENSNRREWREWREWGAYLVRIGGRVGKLRYDLVKNTVHFRKQIEVRNSRITQVVFVLSQQAFHIKYSVFYTKKKQEDENIWAGKE